MCVAFAILYASVAYVGKKGKITISSDTWMTICLRSICWAISSVSVTIALLLL